MDREARAGYRVIGVVRLDGDAIGALLLLTKLVKEAVLQEGLQQTEGDALAVGELLITKEGELDFAQIPLGVDLEGTLDDTLTRRQSKACSRALHSSMPSTARPSVSSAPSSRLPLRAKSLGSSRTLVAKASSAPASASRARSSAPRRASMAPSPSIPTRPLASSR